MPSATHVLSTATLTVAFSFGLLTALPAFADLSESNGSLSSRYITLSIQGDLRGAEELFANSEPLSIADQDLKREFQARFLEPTEGAKNPTEQLGIANDLAAAYRKYWRLGLVEGRQRSEIDHQLSSDLESVRDSHSSASALLLADKDGFPGKALDEAGIYFLNTTTPPYRDLFIWRKQKSARYRVQLTDTSTPVTVNFMDDFVVQGWKEYASLGLATTTGWVENDQLYCVAWAYDTASENFAVSYLKHEARHLVDLQNYPDMQAVELEYRAKLTELSYAHSSLKRILDDFRAKAVENPASAHAMANWQVTRDIYREMEGSEIPDDWEGWGYPDVGRVNRAARTLLEENTRRNDM